MRTVTVRCRCGNGTLTALFGLTDPASPISMRWRGTLEDDSNANHGRQAIDIRRAAASELSGVLGIPRARGHGPDHGLRRPRLAGLPDDRLGGEPGHHGA